MAGLELPAAPLRGPRSPATPTPGMRSRSRHPWRLARALYPVTLAEPATLAATELGAKRDDLSRGLRLVLQEQEVILRSALAARSTPRRWP